MGDFTLEHELDSPYPSHIPLGSSLRWEDRREEDGHGRFIEQRPGTLRRRISFRGSQSQTRGPDHRQLHRVEKEEAWELLQRAPVLILQGVGYATAQGAKEALERRGATVELRAYDMETAGPAPQSSTPPTSWLTVLGIVIAVIVILLIILAVVGI
jgi:hypothetical protein